jgi:DNA-binding transcriptional ArsR family regulator
MPPTPLPPPVPAPSLDAADHLSRVFHGLSDPTRLRIVQLLLDGEKNVGELVAALGAPQGRVSSHLMCLRWCGFVATRRAGKHVYYRVDDPRVGALVRLAQDLLIDNAQAIASCHVINRER